MKIGILSDIHGNSFALQNVLIEAKKENIEQLLILGDYVGYYHHPDRVVELLSDWKTQMIKGNHETILSKFIKNDDLYKNKIRAKYGLGHDAALEKLSKRTLNNLINLPDNKIVSIDNWSIILAHGSPNCNEEYIYPDAKLDVLNRIDKDIANYIFMGHTHYPFTYKGKHSHIINVGSVGQSRVMGGIANWGILNTTNGVYVQKHTAYNVQKLINELLLIKGTPNYLIKILTRK